MSSTPTVLNHEFDHGLRELTDPEGKTYDKMIFDADYGNKEEKRVITGSEQETARKHGEIEEGQVTRTKHEGKLYPTKGPTNTQHRFIHSDMPDQKEENSLWKYSPSYNSD